jgi:MYXO-CTERM domain-containing protein
MDGIYREPLYVANSGTSDAWITFEADECATPIIEGEGVGPDDDSQANGVHSTVAEYVRFRGLVARGWNIGFGNGWADGTESDAVSNGHWEIEHCISYSNGRTGFTFFSAEGFKLKNSISAHNGSSVAHSWSSGVTLFEATGTDNRVEGTLSFENTDAQRNTDGSGFIVDEQSNGASFVNNIAFGNSGSCIRLTLSSGTRFINNTCFHNSQFGERANGPTNPGEIYFNNPGFSDQGVAFFNNLIVGTGEQPAGPVAVVNPPESGWNNNVVVTGSVNFLTDPTGQNPSFVPGASATELIAAGAAGIETPTSDIGFDPKCLVKRTPVMVGSVASESWWQFDIDIDYIMSIGGVASCFNPTSRTDQPDVGAYAAGDVMTVSPGSCIPPEPVAIINTEPLDAGAPDMPLDMPLDMGAGGVGGATATGEMAPGAGGGSTAGEGAGGTLGASGAGGAAGTTSVGTDTVMGGGGQSSGPGTTSPSNTAPTPGNGAGGVATGAPTGVGAPQPTASSTAAADSPALTSNDGSNPPSEGGCNCRVAGSQRPRGMLAVTIGLFAGALRLVRRRRLSGVVRAAGAAADVPTV